MLDYATAFGGLAFIIGILLVGLSGNKRMRLKTLSFSLGALLIVAATVAETSALLAERGSSSVASQTTSPSAEG
jgi:hypothetical protein